VSRFEFVADHRGAFGVKRLCRVLRVSRSGFYRWIKAAPARAARAAADTALAQEIKQIHEEFDGTYGSPRITAELREKGREVNHKRVARVMRRIGIVGGCTCAKRCAPLCPSRPIRRFPTCSGGTSPRPRRTCATSGRVAGGNFTLRLPQNRA
jgi:transposase InsO family protein